jgi:hypothetical protein
VKRAPDRVSDGLSSETEMCAEVWTVRIEDMCYIVLGAKDDQFAIEVGYRLDGVAR